MARVGSVRLGAETLSKEFVPEEPVEDVVGAFKADFSTAFKQQSRDELVFDMEGVDPAIANAVRRTLMGEVSTMAIHTVSFRTNTSIMQDEVLAHRLGLVPLAVDPLAFEQVDDDAPVTPTDTLVFTLRAEIPQTAPGGAPVPAGASYNVFSRALVWKPLEGQAERFKDNPPRPVHDDILLLKLKPGQCVDLECTVRRGVGRDHAKYSPVATAYYRFHPDVTVAPSVTGALADELVEKCPMGVFDIEDVGGSRRAVAANPRNCTMCRECIRHPGWSDRVTLRRKQRHFIFHVESSGAIPARELVVRAIDTLKAKCQTSLRALDETETAAAMGGAGAEDEDEGMAGLGAVVEDDEAEEEVEADQLVFGDARDQDSGNESD